MEGFYLLNSICSRNERRKQASSRPDNAIFFVSFSNPLDTFPNRQPNSPDQAVTFANVGRIVSDIDQTGVHEIRTMGPPRVFRSHEASDPWYRRVIHIVRDPPDVGRVLHPLASKGRQSEDKLPIETYVSTLFLGRDHAYGIGASP